MPKFEVGVTRTLTVTTIIEVSAKNEEEADAKAEKLAGFGVLTWKINDKLDWEEISDYVRVYEIEEL